MAKKKNPRKVITGADTRWSYVNVWEPKTFRDSSPKYSVSLIIPKSDAKTVRKIRAAIQAAYEEGKETLKGKGESVPALEELESPLRDGDIDRADDVAYAGSYFLSAKSVTAPGIVDEDCFPIMEHSEIYSGVYGRASVTFYAFNKNENKGIACGLNNLQKYRDGELLGGKSSPEDDFGYDEDDEYDYEEAEDFLS